MPVTICEKITQRNLDPDMKEYALTHHMTSCLYTQACLGLACVRRNRIFGLQGRRVELFTSRLKKTIELRKQSQLAT